MTALASAILSLLGCSHGGNDATSQRTKTDGTNPGSLTIGALTFVLPPTWRPVTHDRLAALSQEFEQGSKNLYERYNRGVPNPSRKLDLAAYSGADGATFTVFILDVPPQADLIGDLKRELPQKAKWAVEQGIIKSQSEVHTVTHDGVDGFFTDSVDGRGTHMFSGALAQPTRSNEVYLVTLSNATGDDAAVFQGLMDSVRLTAVPNSQSTIPK